MQQAIRQETHTSVCVGIITTQAADLRTMLRTRDESFLVHHGLGLAWGAVEVGGAARCFCSGLFPSLQLFGDSDSEKIHVRLSLSPCLSRSLAARAHFKIKIIHGVWRVWRCSRLFIYHI